MKRPRPDQKAAYNVHKRQKLEAAKPATDSNRRRVRINDLPWHSVSMPDRLEDFEGFYGLEEIDDVVVVKETTGQVSFETSKSEGQLAKEQAIVEDAAAKEEKEREALLENGDQSWEGFSDEEEEASIDTGQSTDMKKKKKALSEKERPEQKTSHKDAKKHMEKSGVPALEGTPAQEDSSPHSNEDTGNELSILSNGAFNVLADRNAEEDDEIDADMSAWEDLGISSDSLDALSNLKFFRPTPIQQAAIPEIMAGRDVIGKASTGSGKTLAFGIPILERFLAQAPTSAGRTPVALIISPTRELAHQLSQHLTNLAAGGNFDAPRMATITGGLSVQKQRRQLEKADIMIGTPGRLWEVISSGQGLLKSIKRIKYLVIDEADRLLSQGHYQELEQILKVLDKDDESEGPATETTEASPASERQTLVFSATFQKGLQQKLAGKGPKGGDLMNNQESMQYLLKKLHFREEKPKFIDANPATQMASGLREGLIECAGTEKDLYLYALLLYHPGKRSLVFTNSVAAVRRLAPFLQNLNLPALPLHSSMAQKARLRSVERFTRQPGSILVATDVAARGLDIPDVELIIHYHLPRAADTYVHRSGRTARASAQGSSILICAPEEVAGVRRLIAKVHARAADSSRSRKTAKFIRTLDIDRRIVSRLKPRATLSKTLADVTIAKEKKHSEDDWMRAAAEELGVDYDSESFDKEAKGRKGRGSGRKKKEKEAREMSKGDMQGLRAELKGLLVQRINAGVSARYLTSGGIDVDALIAGSGNVEFLGDAGSLGFEDDD